MCFNHEARGVEIANAQVSWSLRGEKIVERYIHEACPEIGEWLNRSLDSYFVDPLPEGLDQSVLSG